MTRRPPCVAGRFYPGEAASLKKAVESFLIKGIDAQEAVSIIAPHAGYVYSGAVAGAIYSAARIPDTVILIGPNHTGLGEQVSIMPEGAWEIPTGTLEINAELSDLILENGLFTSDSSAHMMEHSLEVQLPFIKALNDKAAIVPITVMHADASECAALGEALAGAVKRYGKPVLIVVSSDMNHYEPDARTREKDRLALDRVLQLDADGLLRVTKGKNITMCGVVPAAIAINASRRLGAKEATLVKYATSGETSGDLHQVVGYAGVIIK